uniref:7TM_GPCR_Srx domain-containing protein n=1 Tax=Ascaris lumbricoides TaxID=6252 RepID=A0A0M3IEQ6_ASCLU
MNCCIPPSKHSKTFMNYAEYDNFGGTLLLLCSLANIYGFEVSYCCNLIITLVFSFQQWCLFRPNDRCQQ